MVGVMDLQTRPSVPEIRVYSPSSSCDTTASSFPSSSFNQGHYSTQPATTASLSTTPSSHSLSSSSSNPLMTNTTTTTTASQSISSGSLGSSVAQQLSIMKPSATSTAGTSCAMATLSVTAFVEPVMQDESLSSTTGPFDMRGITLSNFPATSSAYKANYKTGTNLISRSKSGVTSSSVKALNLLRQSLQRSMNEELHNVMQKYIDTFFKPAIDNIRQNNGDSSVSDTHVQSLCREILDEAKKMYFLTGLSSRNQKDHPAGPDGVSSNNGSPSKNSLSVHQSSQSHVLHKSPSSSPSKGTSRKRPITALHPPNDSDNDTSDQDGGKGSTRGKTGRKKMKKKKKLGSTANEKPTSTTNTTTTVSSGTKSEVDRSGQRWDPDRLTENTLFVLGSKANKALGFGAARGKMYMKHPHLFRYIGDKEDSVWLVERKHMPPNGGKAYLLVKDDVVNLLESPEYKSMPGVRAEEMGVGFTLVAFIIDKMKALMNSMRAEGMKALKPTVSSITSTQTDEDDEDEDGDESGDASKDLTKETSFTTDRVSPSRSNKRTEKDGTNKEVHSTQMSSPSTSGSPGSP